MRFDRSKLLAVLLGVAILAMAGTALAGTTAAPNLTYGREVGQANRDYVIPAAQTVTRSMLVIRSVAQDFFVDVTLGNGAVFDGAGLPAAGDLTVTGAVAPTYVIIIASGGTAGTNTVRYYVDITTVDMEALPTLNLDVSAWVIQDVANVLGGGGSISISLATADSATNIPFDTGNESDGWLYGAYGTSIGGLTPTTAVVDVATNRTALVATAPDTITEDNGATIGVDNSVASILTYDGTAYSLIAGSVVRFTLAGDLTGINSFSWNAVSKTITAGERTAGSSILDVPGDNAGLTGAAQAIQIVVDNTTVKASRTLTLQVEVRLSGGLDGPAANNRTLMGATTVTTWTLNGTVLLSNWTNGNNAFMNGRLYIWNPTSVSGGVTIRVFTLPVGFAGSTLLGTVSAGTLAASSGVNIRVAEDILTPLAIALPYTTNGGNLVIEVTINAANCSGYSQVFTSGFAYGTVPMTRIQ